MSEVERGANQTVGLGRNPKTVVEWFVWNESSKANAKADLLSTLPPLEDDLLLSAVSLEEFTSNSWKCRATYGINPIPEEGEIRYSASTKGGRETITQAIATFDAVGRTGFTVPDTFGAIGVDDNGNVNGVEITVPKPFFSLEIHVELDAVTDNYWKNIEAATGMVNSVAYRKRLPHDVMFLGAEIEARTTASKASDPLARLRYDFAVSTSKLRDPNATDPNTTGIMIEGLDRSISKRGWDHLEIRHAKFKDDAADAVVRRPIAAWSRQVLYETDFKKTLGF